MKELFLTTIQKPPEVIVNKFFCLCVCVWFLFAVKVKSTTYNICWKICFLKYFILKHI